MTFTYGSRKLVRIYVTNENIFRKFDGELIHTSITISVTLKQIMLLLGFARSSSRIQMTGWYDIIRRLRRKFSNGFISLKILSPGTFNQLISGFSRLHNVDSCQSCESPYSGDFRNTDTRWYQLIKNIFPSWYHSPKPMSDLLRPL